MSVFSILNCSNDLGSCCQSGELALFLKLFNTFIQLIQVIVPIVLLVMLCVNLGQLVINPDDKKKEKQILNKFIAASMVFFIPILINLVMGMISTGSQNKVNIAACVQESKNIKVNTSGRYIEKATKSDSKKKNNTKVYTDTSTYHGKAGTGSGTGTVTPGEKITPGEAVIGDSGVKLVPNDSHKKAAIVRKANGAEVAAYAKSWLGKGITYKWGSSEDLRPGGTCDCSGFVYKVLKHFEIIQGGQIRTTVWGSGNVKGTILYSKVSNLVPGDVVFQYFGNASAHVELYIGNNETIGCNGGRGITHGHKANHFKTFIHLTAYD